MADATVSKTVAFGRVGSSPTSGTNHYNNTQTGQGEMPPVPALFAAHGKRCTQ